ncbi:GNAT family N-acetyltransferase [Peribacillus kribbensis]|uniref:GNAT family N-acetyltransferase n=1 Tax=Peribacillus kribbensis TaxID=356658 RepID=UPI0004240252|nr:GNAT family N-acetyltransferase [Peribacillus kribbensis]
MKLFIEKMTPRMAREILHWRYEEPYDFYNNELTDEAMEEMLDGSYYALLSDKKELAGFFCIGTNAQVPMGNQYDVYPKGFIDMGLGMKPGLTGKGNGFLFCSLILDHLKEMYKNIPIRLTVAEFNQRAIHLYEKLGFVKDNEFYTDRSVFLTMRLGD